MRKITDQKKYDAMLEVKNRFEYLLKFYYPDFTPHTWEILEGTNHEGQGDILIDGHIAVEYVRDPGSEDEINIFEIRSLLKNLFTNAQQEFVSKTGNQTLWFWASLSTFPNYSYLKNNQRKLSQQIANFAIENMNGSKNRHFCYELKNYDFSKIFDVLHVVPNISNPQWGSVGAFSSSNIPELLWEQVKPSIHKKEQKLDKSRSEHPDWKWWLLVSTPFYGDLEEMEKLPTSEWSFLPIESGFDHVFVIYSYEKGLKKFK